MIYIYYPHGMMEYWKNGIMGNKQVVLSRSFQNRLLVGLPGANIKEFQLPILSEANFRMVKKFFSASERELGQQAAKRDAKGQRFLQKPNKLDQPNKRN